MSRYFLIPLTALFLASPVTLAPGPLSGLSEAQAASTVKSKKQKSKASQANATRAASEARGGDFKGKRNRAMYPNR